MNWGISLQMGCLTRLHQKAICFSFEIVPTKKPYCTGNNIIYPNIFVFKSTIDNFRWNTF